MVVVLAVQLLLLTAVLVATAGFPSCDGGGGGGGERFSERAPSNIVSCNLQYCMELFHLISKMSGPPVREWDQWDLPTDSPCWNH